MEIRVLCIEYAHQSQSLQVTSIFIAMPCQNVTPRQIGLGSIKSHSAIVKTHYGIARGMAKRMGLQSGISEYLQIIASTTNKMKTTR